MSRPPAGPKRTEYIPKTSEQKLGYLIEGCGEVLAAAGKTARWGWHSVNPELPVEDQETNAEWLLRELGDLRVAVDMMTCELQGKRYAPTESASDDDVRELLARCVKYAHEDGMVTPGSTRLARALAEAEKLLAPNPNADKEPGR